MKCIHCGAIDSEEGLRICVECIRGAMNPVATHLRGRRIQYRSPIALRIIRALRVEQWACRSDIYSGIAGKSLNAARKTIERMVASGHIERDGEFLRLTAKGKSNADDLPGLR